LLDIKVKVVVSEQTTFVAVIVNVVSVKTPAEVPEITPVVVLKIKPLGNEGAIDQTVGVPPVTIGVIDVIGTPGGAI
jgi:hypothetical protein